MIFGRIGFRYLRGNEFFKAYIPEWIAKPLAICPICMSSVYGTLVFWFAYFTDLINYDYIIIVYICYVFALAGLNYLILTIISDE
ncbi:MAG: hypothetical protein IIC75_00385 [Bacteroidetes bacterium]|nr:hypothetical protein [Bacteroidota bacterium]